jgi:hypothetical protein
MNPLLLGGLFDLAGKVFDKIFPDPQQAAQAKLELFKLQQNGELKVLEAETALATGQMEINKVEAASDSFFKSGWRPAVGWICVFGLFYQFVFLPFATFFLALYEVRAVMPAMDLNTLMTLLFGLLGLGGYRTIEKLKGISK